MELLGKDNHISFDQLLAEKNRVLNEIRAQKVIINNKTRDFISPPQATTKVGVFMKTFDRATAVIEGIMLGYKIVNRTKFLFRKKRKKY